MLKADGGHLGKPRAAVKQYISPSLYIANILMVLLCVYICIIVPGHQQLASPSQTLYPSLNMWTINTDTLTCLSDLIYLKVLYCRKLIYLTFKCLSDREGYICN